MLIVYQFKEKISFPNNSFSSTNFVQKIMKKFVPLYKNMRPNWYWIMCFMICSTTCSSAQIRFFLQNMNSKAPINQIYSKRQTCQAST